MTGTVGGAPPDLPDQYVLEVDDKKDLDQSPTWKVISGEGLEVAKHKEEELRISVSCKFHMFESKEEEEEFYKGKREALTVGKIIEGLMDELKKKARIPLELQGQDIPLYKLAPLLVKEFIVPFAPDSADIEKMWEREL